jgi:hypothetical protein
MWVNGGDGKKMSEGMKWRFIVENRGLGEEAW